MKFLRQTVSLTHVWLFLAWNADMVSLGGRRYFLIIVISAKTWYLWFEMIKYLSNLITHQTPETWSQQFWYSLCCHQNICLNQINDTYTPHSYLFCDIVLTDWLVGNLHMTVVTDSFNYPVVSWCRLGPGAPVCQHLWHNIDQLHPHSLHWAGQW